ncbi:MAG: hypothetical protein J7M26_07150 [Armatimonadetes bacterium]|nr:hypothetical protein [Armatimonadota bacterium]
MRSARNRLHIVGHVGVLLVALVLLANVALASHVRFDPAKMMRAAEVKRGMKGYGLTVLQGTEPSKFGVEILGVIPNSILGKPYIIFRVTDGPIIERNAPVMGGMSGSPVFINGKLIGAVAYTRLWEKEPCGGITPIEAMIEGTTGEQVADAFQVQPVRLGGRTYTRVCLGKSDDPDALALQPIASPIYFSQGTERGNTWQQSLLGLLGFDAVPGAGKHDPVPVEMKPGSGVGVALGSGDFLMYTFGTLTWRDGDSIIAFGHPFSGKGKLSLPMTSVYIYDFVPNYRRTDKDGVIMDNKGIIDVDCPWAVGGVVGPKPKLVPAVYRIVDETGDREHTYHVDLAYDRALTPGLALSGLFSSIDALYYGAEKPGIAQIRYRIRGSKGAVFQRSEIFYHTGDPSGPIGAEVSSSMRLFTDNRFEPQEIEDFSAEIHLKTREDVARIERVYTDEQAAVAGKKLTVHVLLKPVGKPLVEKTVTFDLPADLPKAGVRIGVAGGEAAESLRKDFGGFTPEFHSLDGVLKYLERLEKNNQLLVILTLPRPGVAVEDTPLPGLPLVYRAKLATSNRTGVRAIQDYMLKTLNTPWVIQGRYSASLATVTVTGERGKPSPPKEKQTFISQTRSKLAPLVDSVVLGRVAPLEWTAAGVRLAQLPAATGAPQQTPHASKTPPAAAEAKQSQTPPKKKDAALAADKGQVQAKTGRWELTTYSELAKGRPEGLAPHHNGWLVPGLKWGKPVALPEPMVWSIAVHKDLAYVAAGLEGKVYRVAKGQVKEVFKAPSGLFVSAVAVLQDGSVACSTVPEATVYLLGTDGKIRARADFNEEYIWSLLPDGSNLWVGTGRPGRVYRLSGAGKKGSPVVIPAEHVIGLARRGDVLYAATADSGAVYAVKQNRVEELLGWTKEEPTGVAVLKDGTVVVGLAKKASVLALRSNGKVETWYQSDQGVLYSLLAAGDTVFGGLGSPAQVVRIHGEGDWELVSKEQSSEFVGAMALDAQGRVWLASCLPGYLATQLTKPEELAYVSGVHDSQRPAHWTRLLTDLPSGQTSLKVKTRTGASAVPETGLWSAWANAAAGPLGFQLLSPPGRYVQLRLALPSSKATAIKSVVLSYEKPNTPPTLKVTAPTAGDGLHGTVEVKWEAKDPDGDTLQVDLALRPLGKDKWQTVASRLTGKSYKWKTTGTREGAYTLRVTASDLPSRPTAPASKSIYIGPIVIDNTKPKIEVGSTPQRRKDGTTEVELLASDALSGVASVVWRYPKSSLWYTVPPADGTFGGRYETCHLVLPADLKPGTKVTVRVRDLAGNYADMVVTVPGTSKTKTGK